MGLFMPLRDEGWKGKEARDISPLSYYILQWIHTAFWTAESWFHLRLQAIRYIAAYKFIVGTALNLVFTFTESAYAS